MHFKQSSLQTSQCSIRLFFSLLVSLFFIWFVQLPIFLVVCKGEVSILYLFMLFSLDSVIESILTGHWFWLLFAVANLRSS